MSTIMGLPYGKKDTMPKEGIQICGVRSMENIKYVKKGLVYIFSHDEFPGYEIRPGREIDERRIRDHFSQRNFEIVDPFVNLRATDVLGTLNNFAPTKFDGYDCILVFVITQYNNIGKYLAKTGSYTEDEITQWFKGSTTPSLVVKPKLFFFQASKAKPLSEAQSALRLRIESDGGNDELSLYSLPVEANLFIVRSSLDYMANTGGTWFIKEVCQHLNGLMPLHDEILNVSLSAKKKIVGDIKSYIPDVTSTLTYNLYLGDTENTNQGRKTCELGEKNGCVLIFNYDEVYNVQKNEFEHRDGTEDDWKEMEATFRGLEFDVFVEHNLCRGELIQTFHKRGDIFSSYACIFVAVFTHGSNGTLRTTDENLDPTYLFDAVKPYFEGKPKIFIFQVCREYDIKKSEGSVENEIQESDEVKSDIKDDGVETEEPKTSAVDALHDLTNTNPILKMEDTLVLHSTYLGRSALRDPKKGTWFIQELCAEINRQTPNMSTAPLLDIFIRVQQTVAHKEHADRKQMPVYISTLTRKVVVGKRNQ